MTINKIFGIGLSKTGTTSLTKAFRILGYKATHYPFHVFDHNSEKLALKYDKMEKYDAFTDSPIALFYKDLDKRFPGSKFILTTRELSSWLNSCEKHHIWPGKFLNNKKIKNKIYLRTLLNLHQAVFGTVSFDRKAFTKAYNNHLDDVLDYFKDRPQDLLIYDICGQDSWEKLCKFLNQPIPDKVFPKLNVGSKKILKRESRRYFWSFVSSISP